MYEPQAFPAADDDFNNPDAIDAASMRTQNFSRFREQFQQGTSSPRPITQKDRERERSPPPPPPPPTCNCPDPQPAVLRHVKKQGGRFPPGTPFYACARRQDDDPCGFFHAVTKTEQAKQRKPSVNPPHPSVVRENPDMVQYGGNTGKRLGVTAHAAVATVPRREDDRLISIQAMVLENNNLLHRLVDLIGKQLVYIPMDNMNEQ